MRIFAKLFRVFLTTFKANTANINIESSHQNRITNNGRKPIVSYLFSSSI